MKGTRGIRQLALLIQETVTLRRLFVNRFFAVILIVTLLFVGTQVYIEANNDAVLSGTVVDADGNPVSNATVKMSSNSWEASVTRTTRTDENGKYRFDPYNTARKQALSFTLTATKQGLGSASTERMHVLFQNQSLRVDIVMNETAEERR